ncbi:MAG: polyprenyl synthetase family protein [Burkholderiales bacterium]|nr:polyprenyl synthetase family protein [Burkholderiales bacterium]
MLKLIEQMLDKVLVNNDNFLLHEAMRYSSLNGGKRIRPLLAIASGEIAQAPLNTVLVVGVAIELIHCYSLIHDDLPAMDNDDLRRGRATCHKQYSEAVAILAGDALQTKAFELLSSDKLELDLATKVKIIHYLAVSSGNQGMVGGQCIDILSTGNFLTMAQLEQMHMLKTGALIKASILCGYLTGTTYNADIYNNLELVATNIGLLFQITDDILDATANTVTLGKTANKDLINDKATYVKFLGLKQTQHLATTIYAATIELIHQLPHHTSLASLCEFIYTRDN